MSTICAHIHTSASKLQRYSFDYDDSQIPLNGIYLLFEKGECGHSQDRIVRVGTHTGRNKLGARLKEHFLRKNKDRSIFRKNIGRALLNRESDAFLKNWDLDLTTKESRKKNLSSIDLNYQKMIEARVSAYITANFTFSVVEVDNKEDRLMLESKLISTISLCNECSASSEWLGNSSPKVKISTSGLWLVNQLYKAPFNSEDLHHLDNLFNS